MKEEIQKLLSEIDIKIDGNRPWDIKIHNKNFYNRVLSGGSLALGESYVEGWWDCKRLDQFFTKILGARLDKKVKNNPTIIWSVIKSTLFNQQTASKSKSEGVKHYEIGNDLYKVMLDKQMNYSCGYWRSAKTLDEAQNAKLDLICKKLQLRKGMNVLDIGCGWAGFAAFAARNYKVKVTGITLSKEQVKLAREVCKGLDVEIQLKDYRDVNTKFDRIVSIGMFEHVGYKNYHEYMRTVNRCLKDNGLFLLHTIGGDVTVSHNTDPWITKYIFPNSMMPSAKQITDAAEGFFKIEDWHNFGADYDKTLMAWHKNFNDNWDKIKNRYDERFKRMWNYYLLSCAGSFRARQNHLWQIVFSKEGMPGGYQSFR